MMRLRLRECVMFFAEVHTVTPRQSPDLNTDLSPCKAQQVISKKKKKSLNRSVVFDSATPWTIAPQAPSVHGIVQARILEWVVISCYRRSSQTGIKHRSPALEADSLQSEPPRKPQQVKEPQ